MDTFLFLAVISGILVLLLLVLRYKIPAFLALLSSCLIVGLLTGYPLADLLQTIQKGVGNTLGFVAVVVGLGALLGGFLEATGGAAVLAHSTIASLGEKKASWGLLLTGFLIAIPVFFDVAFVILVPVVYSLQRKTGKSILAFALPLLAGLAITHAFIPPTPGPVAVAEILDAPLGWVIIFGMLVGLPTAYISGIFFPKFISPRIYAEAPPEVAPQHQTAKPLQLNHILLIIGWPLFWIIVGTILNEFGWQDSFHSSLQVPIQLLGHPFGALLSANFLAWIIFRKLYALPPKELLQISNKSLQPIGIILLLTGTGGAFKQLLIDTKVGEMLGSIIYSNQFPILLFAFLVAVLVRLMQGSATVAMITAAGLTAPLLNSDISDPQKALIVIAIAAGASIFSHVNDSGFWLVGKYLNLTEKETLSSWSIMTLIIAICGFFMVGIFSYWVS